MLIRRLLGRFIPDEDGVYNAGYDYVDLGLSVYWATMNVGAKYDYEYGFGYQWVKLRIGRYDEEQTTHSKGKYVTDDGLDVPDYLTTLLPEDDMVHRQMGGDWRMPTMDEMNELLTQCSWQAMLINRAIRAYRVTGPNGNTILLPQKALWTSSLCEKNFFAFGLAFDRGGPRIETMDRNGWLYVRGVLDKAEDEGKE